MSINLESVKVAYHEGICRHNVNIVCDKKKCYSCGWNPEVSKARLEQILQARKGNLV